MARGFGVALCLSVTVVSGVYAQTVRRQGPRAASEAEATSDNMKMPSTSITGERQTPDIFFVFPTGKGGNLSMPHIRDYGPDILEPVVKPWFEREQALGASQIPAVTRQAAIDWKEALKSAPPPPAREQPPAAPIVKPAAPPPSIPAAALSRPPPPAPAPEASTYPRGPAAYGPSAYGAPPTPAPNYAPPPPAQPPTYQGVPVLPQNR